MKKDLGKVVGVLLIGGMVIGMLSGCGAKNKETENKSNTGNTQVSDGGNESGKIIEINFPTSWVGVSSSTEWFNDRLSAFNEQYSDKYKVVVEEIAGDQAYVDKLKVLYSSKSLPDVISTGGYMNLSRNFSCHLQHFLLAFRRCHKFNKLERSI